MPRLCRRVPVLLFALGVAVPDMASADLVYLTNGRSLSVREIRVEGQKARLVLRTGGEIECDVALIAGVEPDEVPYVEPGSEEPAREDAIAVASAVTGPFAELIEPLAVRYRVYPALVRAVVETESSFRPGARSPKGAMGLMQLMPGTARQYKVANPYDPEANLEAGVRHLSMLLDRYDMAVALAAYNAGEGAVQRYGGIPPYRETRDYVARVLRRAGLDRHVGK
jgi:soluble lytic murein transglycosylase-like protein